MQHRIGEDEDSGLRFVGNPLVAASQRQAAAAAGANTTTTATPTTSSGATKMTCPHSELTLPHDQAIGDGNGSAAAEEEGGQDDVVLSHETLLVSTTEANGGGCADDAFSKGAHERQAKDRLESTDPIVSTKDQWMVASASPNQSPQQQMLLPPFKTEGAMAAYPGMDNYQHYQHAANGLVADNYGDDDDDGYVDRSDETYEALMRQQRQERRQGGGGWGGRQPRSAIASFCRIRLSFVLFAQCVIIAASFTVALVVLTVRQEEDYNSLINEIISSRQIYVRDTFAQFLIRRRQALYRSVLQMRRLMSEDTSLSDDQWTTAAASEAASAAGTTTTASPSPTASPPFDPVYSPRCNPKNQICALEGQAMHLSTITNFFLQTLPIMETDSAFDVIFLMTQNNMSVPESTLPLSEQVVSDDGYLRVLPLNTRNTTFSSVYYDSVSSASSPSYYAGAVTDYTASKSAFAGVSDPSPEFADSFLFQTNAVGITPSHLAFSVERGYLTLSQNFENDWVLPIPPSRQVTLPLPSFQSNFIMPRPLMHPSTSWLWSDPIATVLQSPGLFTTNAIYDSISFAFPLFLPVLRSGLNASYYGPNSTEDDRLRPYDQDLSPGTTSSSSSSSERFRPLAAGGFPTTVLGAFVAVGYIKAILEGAIIASNSAEDDLDISWIEGTSARGIHGAPSNMTTGTLEEVGEVRGLKNMAFLVWPSTGQIIVTTDPDVPDSRTLQTKTTATTAAPTGASVNATTTPSPTYDPIMPDPSTLTKELWTLSTYPRQAVVALYLRALRRCQQDALASSGGGSTNRWGTATDAYVDSTTATKANSSSRTTNMHVVSTNCQRLVFDDAETGFLTAISTVGDLEANMHCHLLQVIDREPYFHRLYQSRVISICIGVIAAIICILIAVTIVLSIRTPLLQLQKAIVLAAALHNREAEAVAYEGVGDDNDKKKKKSTQQQQQQHFPQQKRISSAADFSSDSGGGRLNVHNDSDAAQVGAYRSDGDRSTVRNLISRAGSVSNSVLIPYNNNNANANHHNRVAVGDGHGSGTDKQLGWKDAAGGANNPLSEQRQEDREDAASAASRGGGGGIGMGGEMRRRRLRPSGTAPRSLASGSRGLGAGGGRGGSFATKSDTSPTTVTNAMPTTDGGGGGGHPNAGGPRRRKGKLKWFFRTFAEVTDLYDAFERMNSKLSEVRQFVPQALLVASDEARHRHHYNNNSDGSDRLTVNTGAASSHRHHHLSMFYNDFADYYGYDGASNMDDDDDAEESFFHPGRKRRPVDLNNLSHYTNNRLEDTRENFTEYGGSQYNPPVVATGAPPIHPHLRSPAEQQHMPLAAASPVMRDNFQHHNASSANSNSADATNNTAGSDAPASAAVVVAYDVGAQGPPSPSIIATMEGGVMVLPKIPPIGQRQQQRISSPDPPSDSSRARRKSNAPPSVAGGDAATIRSNTNTNTGSGAPLLRLFPQSESNPQLNTDEDDVPTPLFIASDRRRSGASADGGAQQQTRNEPPFSVGPAAVSPPMASSKSVAAVDNSGGEAGGGGGIVGWFRRFIGSSDAMTGKRRDTEGDGAMVVNRNRQQQHGANGSAVVIMGEDADGDGDLHIIGSSGAGGGPAAVGGGVRVIAGGGGGAAFDESEGDISAYTSSFQASREQTIDHLYYNPRSSNNTPHHHNTAAATSAAMGGQHRRVNSQQVHQHHHVVQQQQQHHSTASIQNSVLNSLQPTNYATASSNDESVGRRTVDSNDNASSQQQQQQQNVANQLPPFYSRAQVDGSSNTDHQHAAAASLPPAVAPKGQRRVQVSTPSAAMASSSTLRNANSTGNRAFSMSLQHANMQQLVGGLSGVFGGGMMGSFTVGGGAAANPTTAAAGGGGGVLSPLVPAQLSQQQGTGSAFGSTALYASSAHCRSPLQQPINPMNPSPALPLAHPSALLAASANHQQRQPNSLGLLTIDVAPATADEGVSSPPVAGGANGKRSGSRHRSNSNNTNNRSPQHHSHHASAASGQMFPGPTTVSHLTSGPSPSLGLLASLRPRRASVAYINVRNFHDLLMMQPAPLTLQSVGGSDGGGFSSPFVADGFDVLRRYANIIEYHVNKVRGVVDAVHGDQFAITFNIARTVGGPGAGGASMTPTKAAATSMLNILSELDGLVTSVGNTNQNGGPFQQQQSSSSLAALTTSAPLPIRTHGLSIGIASGKALAAKTGSDNIKKLSTIGPLYNEASLLSKIARHVGQHIVFAGAKMNDELDLEVYTALLGTVQMPNQTTASVVVGPPLAAAGPPLNGGIGQNQQPSLSPLLNPHSAVVATGVSLGAGGYASNTSASASEGEGASIGGGRGGSNGGVANAHHSSNLSGSSALVAVGASPFAMRSATLAGAGAQNAANNNGGGAEALPSSPLSPHPNALQQQQQQQAPPIVRAVTIRIPKEVPLYAIMGLSATFNNNNNSNATTAAHATTTSINGMGAAGSARGSSNNAAVSAHHQHHHHHQQQQHGTTSGGGGTEWMYEVSDWYTRHPFAKLNAIVECYLTEERLGGGQAAAKERLYALVSGGGGGGGGGGGTSNSGAATDGGGMNSLLRNNAGGGGAVAADAGTTAGSASPPLLSPSPPQPFEEQLIDLLPYSNHTINSNTNGSGGVGVGGMTGGGAAAAGEAADAVAAAIAAHSAVIVSPRSYGWHLRRVAALVASGPGNGRYTTCQYTRRV